MNSKYQSVKIPFNGFYNGWLDEVLETWLDREIYWLSEEGVSLPDESESDFLDAVDFPALREKYAEAYAAFLMEKIGVKDYEFHHLFCPREYNFRTDEICVYINRAELDKLIDTLDAKTEEELHAAGFFCDEDSGYVFAALYQKIATSYPETLEGDLEHEFLYGCRYAYANSVNDFLSNATAEFFNQFYEQAA